MEAANAGMTILPVDTGLTTPDHEEPSEAADGATAAENNVEPDADAAQESEAVEPAEDDAAGPDRDEDVPPKP